MTRVILITLGICKRAKMMSKAIWSGVFFGFAVSFVACSDLDYQQAKDQESLYCHMVKANKESGGEYGWPDYNSNYDKVCE